MELKRVDAIKHLGSADGNENKIITERIPAGWETWRDVSGLFL